MSPWHNSIEPIVPQDTIRLKRNGKQALTDHNKKSPISAGRESPARHRGVRHPSSGSPGRWGKLRSVHLGIWRSNPVDRRKRFGPVSSGWSFRTPNKVQTWRPEEVRRNHGKPGPGELRRSCSAVVFVRTDLAGDSCSSKPLPSQQTRPRSGPRTRALWAAGGLCADDQRNNGRC